MNDVSRSGRERGYANRSSGGRACEDVESRAVQKLMDEYDNNNIIKTEIIL